MVTKLLKHTFTEIVDTLVGESVVVPLPRELGLDKALGSQGLHGLDNFKVRDINFRMLGKVEILGGDQSTVYNATLMPFVYKACVRACVVLTLE